MRGHDRILRRIHEGVVVLLGLAAVAASQFATVRCTNFGGVDEWSYLSLKRPTFHRADEVVVFRLSKGRLRLVQDWRATHLPLLAAGARYVPRERIGGPPTSVPIGRRALD